MFSKIKRGINSEFNLMIYSPISSWENERWFEWKKEKQLRKKLKEKQKREQQRKKLREGED